MGLPQVQIEFINKARSAIKRSQRGIVALILKDSTTTEDTLVFKSITEVEKEKFTQENYDYIRLAFLGNPNKVIVEKVSNAAEDYNSALTRLKNKRFNYLAIPGIDAEDTSEVATWLKECRDKSFKTFKAVLPNCAGDHEGVINFTTDEIEVENQIYSTSEFTSRIAGILAGLPFTRSATYFVIPEVTNIKDHIEPNEDIDKGELILINDGEKIKIASGVNSLTTISGNKGIDMKDILIIEKMDMNRDDIRAVFEDEYVGKVLNNYDNKLIFLTSLNNYIDSLTRDYNFYDKNEVNRFEIDVEGNKLFLEGQGKDTSEMSYNELLKANTGKSLFINARLKYTNTMADLDLKIYM